MTSTSGWFRSNIIYDTLSSPPPRGSHLEAICAYVFTQRQHAEFLKYKVVAQSLVNSDNSEHVQKVVDDLFDGMFPYKEEERCHTAEEARKFLERQLAKGPEVVSKVSD